MARFLKLNLLVVYRCIWVLLFVGMVRVGAGRGVVRQSLSLATDSVERILTLMKSQNVAIYNKK